MSRTIFFIGVIGLAFFSCKQTETKETPKKDSVLSGNLIKNPNTLTGTEEKLPELTFETTSHDFGKMNEGDKVEYDFRFTNTGEAPLLISDVKASCGCTTPDWPRGVIKAGASDVIKVVFNSQGHPGTFSKGIVVTANTYPNQTLLKITGVVFKK